MEIKKVQFDQRPLLVELEGAVVRINFDIEASTAVVNNMSGNEEEPETREVFLAHVVRVENPVSVESIKAAVVAKGFDEFKAEAVAAEAMLFMAQNGQHVGDPVVLAKRMVIARISAYDKSEAVNQFTYNGVPMWLDKETRNGLIARLNAEKSVGKKQTTLWLGEQSFNITITNALQFLNALEVYASECYDKTAEHKAAVSALEDIEDIEAYDYTDGYPTHPEF